MTTLCSRPLSATSELIPHSSTSSLRQGAMYLSSDKTFNFLKVMKGLLQSYPAYLTCNNHVLIDATGNMWMDCYVPGQHSHHHLATPDPDHDQKVKLTPPLSIHIGGKETKIQHVYYQSARKLSLETPEGDVAITFDVFI